MVYQPKPNWQQQAACKNTPISVWFDKNNHPKHAIRICDSCPVKRDCGADAYLTEHGKEFVFGVRAGMAPTTRQRLYRKLASY